MRGLLLGLAAGSVCLATCAPILAPFLLAEGKSTRWNIRAVGAFLGGRLIGYLLFGVVAWFADRALPHDAAWRTWLFAGAYLGLAAALAVYGLRPERRSCPAVAGKPRKPPREGFPHLTALTFGFLTGVNLCPPFLAAFTEAVATGTLAGSVAFFLFFFLGTSVYFAPAPFLGVLRRFTSLRTVGRLASILVGAYYLYKGIIFTYGGIVQS